MRAGRAPLIKMAAADKQMSTTIISMPPPSQIHEDPAPWALQASLQRCPTRGRASSPCRQQGTSGAMASPVHRQQGCSLSPPPEFPWSSQRNATHERVYVLSAGSTGTMLAPSQTPGSPQGPALPVTWNPALCSPAAAPQPCPAAPLWLCLPAHPLQPHSSRCDIKGTWLTLWAPPSNPPSSLEEPQPCGCSWVISAARQEGKQ